MKIINFRDLPMESKISAHNWITNSALRSIRELVDDYRDVNEKLYYEEMNKFFNNILELSLEPKNQIEIKVVVDNSKNLDYFKAYLIYQNIPSSETRRVIYIYTKFPHRKEDIAMTLAYQYLKDYNILYHFSTRHFEKWLSQGKNDKHNFKMKKVKVAIAL